jgi:hypothetical protein
MYKGQRDPEVQILVRRENCYPYISSAGDKWVEIKIPYRTPVPYMDNFIKDGTIMVKPEQVFYLDDRYGINAYNIITVNDNARIVNSVKTGTNRQVIYQEQMTPKQIIDALLAFELRPTTYDVSVNPGELVAAMESTGLSMLEYIIRVNSRCIDWQGRPYVNTPHKETDGSIKTIRL